MISGPAQHSPLPPRGVASSSPPASSGTPRAVSAPSPLAAAVRSGARTCAHVSACALLFLAAGCAAPTAGLSGRVVFDGEALRNAQVALESVDLKYRAHARTADDGGYTFEKVPAGEYRLTARSSDPLPLIAVPGRLPVLVTSGEKAWVGLQAVPVETPAFRPRGDAAPGTGALRGVVRHKGKPTANVVVTLYLDDAEGLKGPGLRQSFPTGSDGVYLFDDLLEGTYFLAARKRSGNAVSGPLREGDLFAVSPANPVAVRGGEETTLDVHLLRKEKDESPSDPSAAPLGAALLGRVVDEVGNPVPGVFVFAYRNRTIGHGMPDHISLPTAADGSFQISLSAGGLFYVGAREKTGGSPSPGERFGLYEGSPDHALTVPKGKTIGPVRITVRKVLEP